MNRHSSASRRYGGFTIVELLIVVVVIAILASVTIVAFRGVQDRAINSMLQSTLNQATKALAIDYTTSGTYPDSLEAANNGKGIAGGQDVALAYRSNNATSPPSYCLSATSTRASALSYKYDSTVGASEAGACMTPGLAAAFYGNKTLSGAPVLTRTDATVDFSWGSSSPGPGVAVDNFSVRWSGYVTPTVSGSYTFTVTSDDGERLYVNNSLIVDRWVNQGPTAWSGTITLTQGVPVPIVYEMYEGAGGAVARLQWVPPSGSLQTIPAAALSN